MNANDDETTYAILANTIIRLIEEDPTKIIAAIEDADMMIANGAADEGQSRHSLMAESMMHEFKVANAEFADMINLYDDEIHDLIVAHLEETTK